MKVSSKRKKVPFSTYTSLSSAKENTKIINQYALDSDDHTSTRTVQKKVITISSLVSILNDKLNKYVWHPQFHKSYNDVLS